MDDQIILDFLHEQPMATLSTVGADSGTPQAALIAFVETKQFEIVFETFGGSRKYRNLKHNGAVALVVGFSPTNHVTFQYEGVATEVGAEAIASTKALFADKDTPCSAEFLEDPRVRFFKITPRWLRYSDYRQKPPFIINRQFTGNLQG